MNDSISDQSKVFSICLVQGYSTQCYKATPLINAVNCNPIIVYTECLSHFMQLHRQRNITNNIYNNYETALIEAGHEALEM